MQQPQQNIVSDPSMPAPTMASVVAIVVPTVSPEGILDFLKAGSKKCKEIYVYFGAIVDGSKEKNRVRHALDALHKAKAIDWSDDAIVSLAVPKAKKKPMKQ